MRSGQFSTACYLCCPMSARKNTQPAPCRTTLWSAPNWIPLLHLHLHRPVIRPLRSLPTLLHPIHLQNTSPAVRIMQKRTPPRGLLPLLRRCPILLLPCHSRYLHLPRTPRPVCSPLSRCLQLICRRLPLPIRLPFLRLPQSRLRLARLLSLRLRRPLQLLLNWARHLRPRLQLRLRHPLQLRLRYRNRLFSLLRLLLFLSLSRLQLH